MDPLSSFGMLVAMRLRKLYTATLHYETEPRVVTHPDGTGRLYGRGSGIVDWDGVEGTVAWSNFPRHLPGDIYEPRVTGSIDLAGETLPILFELNGVSDKPDSRGTRPIVATVRWRTAIERFAWLNTSIGVEEGTLDGSTFLITTTTYLSEPG